MPTSSTASSLISYSSEDAMFLELPRCIVIIMRSHTKTNESMVFAHT